MYSNERVQELLDAWEAACAENKPFVPPSDTDPDVLEEFLIRKRRIEVANEIGDDSESTIDRPEGADGGQPADNPPQTPPTIPGFEIREFLGEGGMGVVWRARQQDFNRDVAIKVIKNEPFATINIFNRFKQEIQTLVSLDHDNIVHVWAADVSGGRPYFAMQYVDGKSLAQLLRENPKRWRTWRGRLEAVNLLAIVAKALHYAHKHGVFHRDLKPANILLTAR
jgi:serine/threonine protein kinase